MIVGAAQVDITPMTVVELSGFAARIQPMTGVLDPIYAKALYLSDGDERLLWVHIDALALGASFVQEFREWALREHAIRSVLLSATHTHAAPATVTLTACGRIDPEYLKSLQQNAQKAASDAIARTKSVELVFAQSELHLAIDRRGKPSAHIDPIVSAIGWKRPDDTFVAALLNYPMHPVALGHVNRCISADWCGAAADEVAKLLPGNPITLVTNGACGNLNPPQRPVPPDEMRQLGRSVASSVIRDLQTGQGTHATLKIAVDHVDLPLEWLEPGEIDQVAAARSEAFARTEWAGPFREAIATWRDTQKTLVQAGRGRSIDIELFAIELGAITILAVSGEIFSRFTAALRKRIDKPLFVVGYANAGFGYIPTHEAYDEGGYEVNEAHFFYNSFRPKQGGLEMLADRAAELLRFLSPSPSGRGPG